MQQKYAKTRVRGSEEMCMSASPKEMVNLSLLLGRQHSSNSVSSADIDFDSPLSPTSEDEPMSVDSYSPVRRRNRYTSESEASITEVGHYYTSEN